MKHQLIAEIIGRLYYVRKHSRTHKVVRLASAVHDDCKLVSIRRLPRLSVVSGSDTNPNRPDAIIARRKNTISKHAS